MGQLLIRGLDESVIEKLRKRADGNDRSLEGELREILVRAARQFDIETARKMADEFRHRLEGRIHSDSTDLIREDRDQ